MPDKQGAPDSRPEDADQEIADQIESERRRMAQLLQRSVIDSLNLLLAQTNAYEQTLSAHLEREAIVLQDLFTFVEGPRDGERVQGQFAATGQIPSFLTLLKQRGIDLPVDLFKRS
jgi:uncharacterized membrane protein YccC